MKGKLIIYYGNGDGKTTAALGHAVRFAGYGKKVAIICFMKGRISGEVKFLKGTNIDLHLAGPKDFLIGKKNLKEHKICAEIGFELAKKVIRAQIYDVLVLDEILYVIKYKLVDVEDLISLIKKRKKMHMILTGGPRIKKLIELADIVSEVREIKHWWHKEKKTIKGFDY